MLKTHKGELNPRLVSALVYVQSLLGTEEELTLFIKSDKVTVATSSEELLKPLSLDTKHYPNAISNMLEHVNEEMCTDCIQIDYLYKDPYFKSLVSTYADSLIHEYGWDVPIPNELAIAILKHDITNYNVRASKDTTLTWPSTAEHVESLAKQGWLFHLRAQ
jgi:hypothetical protein